MREHQIVITLKPDQFAQIQQMSKAAGAKSMGIFVRKTLLAALKIEGIKPTLGQPTNDHDPSLLVDLQRLHGELRELISESLLSVQQESFDPFSDLVDELDDAAEPDEEPGAPETEDKLPLSDEEPIASSIKVADPLNELLDEGLKTRLESFMDYKRKAKPKDTTTKEEPEIKPPSQSISHPDEMAEENTEKTPKPKPRAPRSIPPDPQPTEDKTGFSKKSLPLSGNPPPKKPKH